MSKIRGPFCSLWIKTTKTASGDSDFFTLWAVWSVEVSWWPRKRWERKLVRPTSGWLVVVRSGVLHGATLLRRAFGDVLPSHVRVLFVDAALQRKQHRYSMHCKPPVSSTTQTNVRSLKLTINLTEYSYSKIRRYSAVYPRDNSSFKNRA